MIRLYNCQTSIEFTTIREACQKMGFAESTIYNKGLPCEWGGFYWEIIPTISRRHITCTKCGSLKWDNEFYKASKQSENLKAPIRVNQPCKSCIKKKKNDKTGFYNPKTRIY